MGPPNSTMKFLRLGSLNKEKPAILDENGIRRDLSSIVVDFNPNTINADTIKKIKKTNIKKLPEIDQNVRIGACVSKPEKFIGIGLNYKDHAKETGMKEPDEPIVFIKANSCISGPNDNVVLPKKSKKTDWEVELGIIIGKEARYISEKNSQDYIAGYCVINDISEREFQFEHLGQWVKGKSCDTFGPIGPYIVTKDEILDPQNLKIWLKVNNNIMQNGSTSKMIFSVNFLVSYISQFMSLQPGDVISSGTPSGVGAGMKPPVFLKEGDNISLGIEGLGEQNQKIISY